MSVTITCAATDAVGATASTTVVATQSAAAPSLPLSWNDPMFANVVDVAEGWPGGSNFTISNASLTSTASDAVIGGTAGFTLDTVRLTGREGIRVSGPGTYNINKVWLDVTGLSGDHCDGLQAYSPGSQGTIKITNTTFRCHDTFATAGLWVSDNYGATVVLNNVAFWGGPYGLRFQCTGSLPITASFKDVFFIGPFLFGDMLFQPTNAPIHILQWDNVRTATVVNGVLVPGALINPPWSIPS